MQLQLFIQSILLVQLISHRLAGPAEQEQCGEEVDRLKREALSTAQIGKQEIRELVRAECVPQCSELAIIIPRMNNTRFF